MTEPRVLNMRHKRSRSADAVYIGRPTQWGNPFQIGRDGDRAEVIAKYRAWLMAQPDLVTAVRRELKGRSLICWCAPQPCHGDVLIEVANQPD